MGDYWRTRRGKFFLSALAVIVVLAVAGGIAVALHKGSGAEAPNAAAFVGHASNAVMFIQWTRDGQSVTGSLKEAIAKNPAGSGLSSAEKAFTGTINGNGLSLNVEGAEGGSSTYVGEVKGQDFTLTLPGQGSTLTSINFEPGEVSTYNEGTHNLLVGEYQSPCVLYVVGHAVRVEIEGENAAEDCANFVQKARSSTEWTTNPQSEASASNGVVCKVENRSRETADITDIGGQEYGHEACNQLTGEGWG
jgi:hypothetical protein